MLKLSSSFAACATAYSAFILQESADFEAGNVTINYSLCAALALLTATLIMLATPKFEKATIALTAFRVVTFITSALTAVAAWSIPSAGATDILGIVTMVVTIPLLGIFSVSSVALSISGLIVDVISTKRDKTTTLKA